MRFVSFIFGASLIFSVFWGVAHAEEVVPSRQRSLAQCDLPHNLRYINSINELPHDSKARLLEKTGEMADVNEPFNSSDMVRDADVPQHRFMSAGVYENKVIIWYEHGGRGYHNHVVGFTILNDEFGRPYRTERLSVNFTQNLCGGTRAILDNVTSSDPQDW